MFRRFCLLLGTAALATSLVAAPSYAASATPRPKLTCDPAAKNKATAPAIGAQSTFQAGGAGSVVVKRADATTITVASTSPTTGWTATVSTPSGRRVRVLFRNAGTGELEHIGVGMSARGTFVMVTTSHCHH
jgi:opacity protein-like surface antigen